MSTLNQFIAALPAQPRKQVLKSLIGSLNSSIIGYARGHIRNSRFENVSRSGETPNINTLNEALAEHSEVNADMKAMQDMGLLTLMPAIDVALRMEVIRVWAVEELASLATHPADVPLTIKDTITFQIKRAPDINEPVLKALALALNLDIEVLKAAKVQMHDDDRKELIDMEGQIIDLVADLNVDTIDVDEAISSLPVHLQYKLLATLSSAIKKAGNKALTALLRYSRIESAGDITLIKAVHADVYAAVENLMTQKSVELGEYQERGGRLIDVVPMS